MTTVEALKTLYTALGGESADIENVSTTVGVLNMIGTLFEGDGNATVNSEAVANIAAVAENITGGTTFSSIPENFDIKKNLTAISIPEGVTGISPSAFAYSKLVDIIIPEGVTTLSGSVFNMCQELTNVVLPDSLKTIGSEAFAWCTSLTELTIPKQVTTIESSAFNHCIKLKEITIPSSVTSIGNNAFLYCNSLETITINKPENSISGAPWSANNSTNIVWTG